jgi:hypothetical protein
VICFSSLHCSGKALLGPPPHAEGRVYAIVELRMSGTMRNRRLTPGIKRMAVATAYAW